MAGFTNYGENQVINRILRESGQLYVGLLANDPTEGGDYSSEIKAPSYERVPITFIEPHLGETYNQNDLIFNTAIENWGWISYIAVFDSKNNGNMITYAALDFRKEIRAADIYKIPSAYFIFSLD